MTEREKALAAEGFATTADAPEVLVEPVFPGHRDDICCPDCHEPVGEDGTCPKCGRLAVNFTDDCGMGQ